MTNLNQPPPDYTAPADLSSSSLRSADVRKDFKQKIPELLQLERLLREEYRKYKPPFCPSGEASVKHHTRNLLTR